MCSPPQVVGRHPFLEVPVTEPEPTPTTEDGEVIGIPPEPPVETEPIDPNPPAPVIFQPPAAPPGDEVDPADL
jgi:hypothetical protein